MSTEIKLIRLDEIEPLVKRLVSEALEAQRPAAPQQDTPEYLSIKKASARFDIPEKTFRNWLDRGHLTRHKIRGSLRLKVSEIESLIKNS